MNPFEFVLVIILAGMGFSLIKHRHDVRHGIVRDHKGRVQQIDSGREAELQREVEDLRERIKVLERIATEDRDTKRLSAEIESLRDK